MAGYDYRMNPADTDKLSFYVFDNLRSQQDREGGSVFRYDSVQEAIAAFQYIQSEHPTWTIALGGSINGTREIDFIQRLMGDNVVVNDYRALEPWNDSLEVNDAVDLAASRLQAQWQADRSLIGTPILTPYDPEQEGLIDPYLADKRLRPTDPDNVLTSIQEAFVQGDGWMPLQELQMASRAYGYNNPECPKVSRFNVAYRSQQSAETDRTSAGYADITPSDFKYMKVLYLEAMQERGATTQENLSTKAEEHPAKTMEGWHAFAEATKAPNFDDYVHAGDVVGEDVVDYFVNLLPPATLREHLVQMGSAYDSRIGKDGHLHPTFATFAKEEGAWRYCGHCFRGEVHEPPENEASFQDLRKEAKERAAEKNAERPEKQHSKKRDLER